MFTVLSVVLLAVAAVPARPWAACRHPFGKSSRPPVDRRASSAAAPRSAGRTVFGVAKLLCDVSAAKNGGRGRMSLLRLWTRRVQSGIAVCAIRK